MLLPLRLTDTMTMPDEQVLIVEDDPAIRVGLEEKLRLEGYRVAAATDGEEALERIGDGGLDLVVLDLMLPKQDGLTVLRWLRQHDGDLPVLILSAKGQEEDKVQGLRAGADDYLAKPFGLDELMARIEALLRRTRSGSGQRHAFGPVEVDLDARKVFRDGEEIELSRKEAQILTFLLRHAGEVVSRDQVLAAVWGPIASSEARAVDFHILNLRRKIEADPKNPRHIVTRHGLGYQLRES